MVKSYSKYELSQTFGLVASSLSNIISVSSALGSAQAVTGANEEVLVWDVKTGELVSRWKESSCTSQVTVITRSLINPDIFAVGCVRLSLRPSYSDRIAAMKMARSDFGISRQTLS